ncbi:uncharacterized protein LOC114300873 [Camellia sinensis]|uniref:uncharacterized protein LOC114300873 n=1 Tax=Camellia sinensis TaxID=4442 RepID=UPI0010356C51|nr:uncharacterized protein LOC114300873 [Camellia sinensis]
MENCLFLMCKFRGVTLVIKYNNGFNFKDLVYKLCAKWSELVGSFLNISYSRAGHSSCGLESEEDLEVMVRLAFSCDIHRIDVFVKCCSLGEGYLICDGETSSSSSSSVVCETDFLPSFYSNQWKPLLSDGWVNCMKGVGQRFAQGVVEFRDALSKYYIHSDFNFDFVKNDKDRVTVHCKRRADLGCLWSVHARVENYSKAFVIKQFDDVHTCGSSFRTIKHARMTSSMIGGLISSDIRNKALTSVSEVVCDFKDYYGTKVSYRRSWMGVEKAKGLVFGDYSSSFDDLRWYVDAANACNLGSVFDMEFDIDSKGRHFKCLFFAFEACIHGFKYCRPVLMLDGTFLKGRHKGCLLAATAKDGNQGLYPLCFAIVDGESYDSWHWFLSKLLGILTLERDIAFVTNRHRGLLKALAEVFPFSCNSFCLMHLKRNLKTYLSVKSRESKEYLLTLFSRCAYAPTIELLNELFEEFKGRCGRNVERFLEDLPNECWCNAYFQGKRYGEMCTNAAESFNSWIRDERHLFSTSLVDAIRVKLMEQFSRRKEVGNKWNRIVCPFAEKKLEEAFNDTKAWIVKKCSDDIYEIQLDHSVMVDIGKRCCSCRLWEIDSFPYKHGFCAIKRSEKDLNCFLDDYYRVSSYCDSYSHSIYPVPSMWKPNVVVDDDVVLPPLCKRPAGHLRTERIPSKGEIKRIRCSRCEKMRTHNRKTCKQALF